MRALAVVMLAVLAVGVARAEDVGPKLTYADDRVTGSVEQVDVADVLAAIGRASGAEVKGAPVVRRKVTAEFERTPVSDALQRLLGEQNFTLRYGEGGKLKLIALRGGPEEPMAVASTPPAAGIQTTTTTIRTGIQLPRRFAQHRPVPVPDRIKDVLGKDTATFDEIFQLATTDDDGVVRALSMQLALSALERERLLRVALFQSLRHGEEGSLGAYLQTPGALEMLQFMAAHSREAGIQKKANLLIEQVRPTVEPPAAGG